MNFSLASFDFILSILEILLVLAILLILLTLPNFIDFYIFMKISETINPVV